MAGFQIRSNAAVTLNGSAFLDISNHSEIIGPLTMTGSRIVSGNGTLTLNGDVTVDAATNSATIAGLATLTGGLRTFTVADGAARPISSFRPASAAPPV